MWLSQPRIEKQCLNILWIGSRIFIHLEPLPMPSSLLPRFFIQRASMPFCSVSRAKVFPCS